MKNSVNPRLNFKSDAIFLNKAFYITFLFTIFFSNVFSGNTQNTITVLSSNSTETLLNLQVSAFSKIPVITYKGSSFLIKAESGTPLLQKGNPDLYKFTASVVIPDRANMEVEIVSSSYTDYPNTEIAPSKGNLSRTINPSTVPYSYSEKYFENKFFPGNLASLRDPYIVRNQRGQTVVFYPFQYNPILKVLRVYNQLTIKVKVKNEIDPVNPLVRSTVSKDKNVEFEKIFKNLFLNYQPQQESREFAPVEEEGRMLIISHPDFIQTMQPFIAWKKQKGMNVEIVDVSSIGNDANLIKDYVQNYYDSTNLAYLLLVGDAPQVVTYISTHGPSDNSYSYVDGPDSYPDFFVGRFSGQTVAEIETQVQRVIDYEKTPVAGSAWHKNGLGYASDQGPGDDNEMDFEHIRNIRSKLLAYTYSNVAELYDGSQGGLDAIGNPSNIDVFNEIQSGVGIINYTGHGSCTSSGTSGFSTSDVANLTNTGMLPFFISVACVNGEFTNTSEVCLAEKFLRQTYNGQPAGAIATLMSTINQSWSPPMEGQDAINDILTESYVNNIKRTFGGITMNGCMQMNDAYDAAGVEMTDTWTVFGDPSLEVRTDAPDNMTVSHANSAMTGIDQLIVNCDVEDALVSLTINGEIIGTGHVSSGLATIDFLPVANATVIVVTITAYNKVPYIGAVNVSTGSGIAENQVKEIYLSPNPAAKSTTLAYTLNEKSKIDLTLYDAVGRIVIDQEELKDSGDHQTEIDLSKVVPGVYFFKFSTGSFTTVKRLVVTE